METKKEDPTRLLKPCQQEGCDGYYLGSKREDGGPHSATLVQPDIPCQKCLERKFYAKSPRNFNEFYVMPSMVQEERKEMAVIRE